MVLEVSNAGERDLIVGQLITGIALCLHETVMRLAGYLFIAKQLQEIFVLNPMLTAGL